MANIKVVDIYGSCTLGEIPIAVDMTVNLGVVAEISGSLIRVTSGNQEGWVYDSDLLVLNNHAVDLYGWPTGVDNIPWDRNTRFPNGFKMNMNAATGITYNNGSIVSSYPSPT